MMSFILKGRTVVAVVTAETQEQAVDVYLSLFEGTEKEPEEIEALQFDPSVVGGILMELNDD